MEKKSFNFEVKDLLTQFLAAFDGTVIKRYDKNRVPREEIEVRYVLAPKQRVMYDIVNKAQNLTLPVVAVSVKSISRDSSRVFNKLDGYYNTLENTKNTSINSMPVPVNIEINMSILARYLQDMDQIISNFVPYNNPYIIISWKEPTNVIGQVREIRSEVLWSGSISLDEPTDLTYSEKFRAVADTSFTIKGWLFKSKNDLSNQIYFIDANFVPLRGDLVITDANYDTFFSTLSDITETVSVSGYPTITDTFYYTATSTLLPILTNFEINQNFTNNFLIYGSNYAFTENILLSTNALNTLTTTLCSISSKYTGSVTGYLLDSENYRIHNDNIMSITFPTFLPNQTFKLVITNPSGWTVSDFNFLT